LASVGGGSPALHEIKSLMTSREQVRTHRGGAFGDHNYEEIPPDGALLTGFSVTTAEKGLNIVQSLQPIFQSGDGQLLGKRHGAKHGKVYLLEAKDGYAVGGLTMRAGGLINGFSVTFMRIESGHLNPKDSYVSDWVGATTGGSEGPMGMDGSFVIGIFGTEGDPKGKDPSICGMGLVTLPAKNAKTPKRGR
jgi:hypothetical protein